ncbi:4'-phosphopantetheinyl transferase family protein [Geomonas subterranea]|uniref:4'-phosphopantetheinyl transferase superfamily protein n=1 Tax=Geomonas subterranea TaxID=2847989 RepID=A0ABX8LM80_9BACT|nr:MULTISPECIES: 4'-phosphopantetheinyl transferase superfamily protein [Geomonas]QXE92026.1 4'-phosphopantetheinyl transferase superfamily protein [Geomonas subterranea]QXM09881.1 4'-phosphopantetheinyl transferase superfamily protein [Geomonas subterranea]
MIAVAGLEAVHAQFRLEPLLRPEHEKVRLTGYLNDAELRRGARLLDPGKREEFLVGRGLVREILAGLTGGEPGRIEFLEGVFGKPYLSSHRGTGGLHFNVSHSGGQLLVAVCYGAEIGVDLEEVRQDLAFRPMAERYFSLREREELFGLDPELQLDAFYRCWTRKEAYLKGMGTGFSLPSTAFDVSLAPGEPPALLAHWVGPEEVKRWAITDLPVPAGYCAALAIQRQGE